MARNRMRIVLDTEATSYLRTKAERDGVYVGPERGRGMGPDSRYVKAGTPLPRDYRFSHERGALPPAAAVADKAK